jgi:hypothetical protein
MPIQPGEKWYLVGSLTLPAAGLDAAVDTADAEGASFANRYGARWDKLRIIPQLNAGNEEATIEVALTSAPLADNAAFTALPAEQKVAVQTYHLEGSTLIPSGSNTLNGEIEVNMPNQGRYLYVRAHPQSVENDVDLGCIVYARLAHKFFGGSNQ